MTVSYPSEIWDGDSANRDSDDSPRKSPDWQDWARIIEEVAATQTKLDAEAVLIDALEAGFTVEVESVGKSGTPNVLLAAESRNIIMNEGVILGEMNFHTLPTAAAGMVFTFVCNHTDGIRVTANTGDTIQINGSTSKAGGYAESTTAGSILKIFSVDATEWIAESVVGVWVLETS